jgi:hypothetical protein
VDGMKKPGSRKVDNTQTSKLDKIEIRKLDKIETTALNSNASG